MDVLSIIPNYEKDSVARKWHKSNVTMTDAAKYKLDVLFRDGDWILMVDDIDVSLKTTEEIKLLLTLRGARL